MATRTISEPVRILMSAINGYGYYYLKTFIEEVGEDQAVLVGVIDPEAEKSGHYPWIVSHNVPIFRKIEDFFKNGRTADLTVISSPPQYHVSQSVIALSHDSNVLVDKPVGATVDSVEVLIEASRKYGSWVEVGYQWSFSQAIQNLKRDIIEGRFGKPVRCKSICLWPRDFSYYQRNDWAGKIFDPDGLPVFDSPSNNACAHFLHNMFFLLGSEMNTSAVPQNIDGEIYRAYDIENYDTVSVKIKSKDDIEMFFYASHVTKEGRDPEFILEFSGGNVVFGGQHKHITGRLNDLSEIDYGSPDDHQFKKLFDAIRRVKEPGPPICPPEVAIAQTICVNSIQQSEKPIYTFSKELIIEEKGRRWVSGLGERIGRAYDENKLLSET